MFQGDLVEVSSQLPQLHFVVQEDEMKTVCFCKKNVISPDKGGAFLIRIYQYH
jgi:hypothetical protein